MISELAVTLAGFSGLIAMVRIGPVHDWHPRVRLAFWIALSWSVAAIALSALPSLLRPFRIEGWAVPSLVLGSCLAAGTAAMLRATIRLSSRGFPTQNPWHWIPSVRFPVIGCVCNLVSGRGLWSSPSYEWYRLGVLCCLAAAMPPFLASFRVRAEVPSA